MLKTLNCTLYNLYHIIRTQAATFLLGVKPVRFFSKLLLAVGTCETNRVPLHCLDQKVFHHHLTLGMSVSKPAQGMPFFMGSSSMPSQGGRVRVNQSDFESQNQASIPTAIVLKFDTNV